MKHTRSVFGVTLLEIMLVLAIAAMVIIMSIRYFNSSTTAQNVNTALQSIQAITSAMDNLANGGGGSYSDITSSTLTSVVGSSNMTTSTNQPITYTPVSATSYQISMPLTEAICTSLLAKVQSNPKIASTAACNGGTFSYTYDNTQS